MTPALRIVLALGLVFTVVSLVLLAADEKTLMQRMADPGALVALVGVVLAAAALALLPVSAALQRAEADARQATLRAGTLESELLRADCRRRELVVTLSHDLRTPLAAMQGYLELLLLRQAQMAPAEAEGYLQTAVRQSRRLARRVDDLFELARLQADDASLRGEAFPLGELAHDVALRFADAAAQAGVALEVACDGAPLVQGEIALVERALGNLLDNALRHTPRGGRVAIEVRPDGQGAAEVGVQDTGEGIAELDGLFDRYEKTPRVGDSGRGGAGLGLAIVRRIAALHGSALQVRSRPGEGTRVSFVLAPARPER